MKYIRTLNQVQSSESSVFGNRACDLAHLFAERLPVPQSFVLTTEAWDAFIQANNIQYKMDFILKQVDVKNERTMQNAYNSIRKLIVAHPLPDVVVQELTEAYESLGPGVALDEMMKEDNAPFVTLIGSPTYPAEAESYEAIIQNVRGAEQLILALKEIFAMAYTPDAIMYRAQIGQKDFRMAIIVQSMPGARASATAYSTDPEQKDMIFVHAYQGYTDLRDVIAKDFFHVKKEFLNVSASQIVEQSKIITRSEDGHLTPAEFHDGRGQSLNDKEVGEVARLAKKSEKVLGHATKGFYVLTDNKYFLSFVNTYAVPGGLKKAEEIKSEIITTDVKPESVQSSSAEEYTASGLGAATVADALERVQAEEAKSVATQETEVEQEIQESETIEEIPFIEESEDEPEVIGEEGESVEVYDVEEDVGSPEMTGGSDAIPLPEEDPEPTAAEEYAAESVGIDTIEEISPPEVPGTESDEGVALVEDDSEEYETVDEEESDVEGDELEDDSDDEEEDYDEEYESDDEELEEDQVEDSEDRSEDENYDDDEEYDDLEENDETEYDEERVEDDSEETDEEYDGEEDPDSEEDYDEEYEDSDEDESDEEYDDDSDEDADDEEYDEDETEEYDDESDEDDEYEETEDDEEYDEEYEDDDEDESEYDENDSEEYEDDAEYESDDENLEDDDEELEDDESEETDEEYDEEDPDSEEDLEQDDEDDSEKTDGESEDNEGDDEQGEEEQLTPVSTPNDEGDNSPETRELMNESFRKIYAGLSQKFQAAGETPPDMISELIQQGTQKGIFTIEGLADTLAIKKKARKGHPITEEEKALVLRVAEELS